MTGRPRSPAAPAWAWRQLGRLLPGAEVLAGYQRRWLASDVVAGLTVGAMLVPQGMAYAELAGMPPQAGLYAALPALGVYALLGSSRHLGVGPEPGTAILAATGVAPLAGGDPARYAALMASLALLVGGFCVVGWVARLGFLAQLLSRPVLLGYITGVGLTLVSSQIGALTGIAIGADRFFPRFWELLRRLDEVDWRPLLLGGSALAVIVGLRRRAPAVPGALVAVTLATVVATVFTPGEAGVALVGPIPRGLPGWAWPEVGRSDLASLLGVAAGIAIVGYTDNVLTARAIARGRGYRIEPNRELFALGAVNISAGLGQGFPISSSASRTAVPAALGSKTQLVGVIGAIFLLASLVVLGPAVERIPRAALAAVVLAAAVAIIDVPGLVRLRRQSPAELGLALATALAVMVVDILIGVLAAVALSVAHAFRRISRPHDSVLGLLEEARGFVDVEQYPAAHTVAGLLVYRFDAPLFFANTDRFRQRLEEALERNPGEEHWVVLDLEGVGAIDATALDGLEELVVDLGGRGVVVAVARANEPVRARLESSGVADLLGRSRLYPTINAAVDAFRRRETAG